MQPVYLLSGLENRYQPDVCARIVSALRQDDLVWSALEHEDFCKRALDEDLGNPNFWSPAHLALLSISGDLKAENLGSPNLPALEAGLRKQAVRVFEEATKQGIQPSSLRDAGLLALALRERRRMTGNWNGLANELLFSLTNGKQASSRIWRTSLACLAGYIPDLPGLQSHLLKAREIGAGADWILHILLTSPNEDSEKAKLLAQTLAEEPASKQLEVLKSLRLRAGNELTAKTAELVLSGHPLFAGLKMKADLDQASVETLSGRILTLQQLASFNFLAGSPAQAEACLRLAKSAMNYWQAGLDLQSLSMGNSELTEIRETSTTSRVFEFAPSSKRISKELSYLAVQNLKVAEIQDKVDVSDEDPMVFLRKALKAQKENEPALMRELGAKASYSFLNTIREQDRPFISDFIYSWSPLDFIRALIFLELDEEAEICAEAALKVSPSDATLISIYTKLMMDHGKFQAAKVSAQLAVTLMPSGLELRRQLAEADEKSGDWEAGYRHRKDCLALCGCESTADTIAFAQTAIQAGKPEEAVDVCNQILAADPDQAGAHGWLGMALAKLGQNEEAASHLQRATLLASDEAEWWLKLADMYAQADDRKQAYDTLRAAVMAVPESGPIYAALGAILLADSQSAEALLYLKRARELLPEDEKVGLQLSKSLHILGHLNDARFIMEKLHHKWAVQPELAYEFAKVAIEQGDTEGAIPALEVAVRSEQARPEWMLDYASVLLSDHSIERINPALQATRYVKAERALQKVLATQPGDLQAQIMMADSLRKQGNYEQALALYQELAENTAAIDSDQLWKVQHGLGLAALELNMTEPALVAIRDAATRQPNDIELQRDLTRAYMAVSLPQDATRSAMAALELAAHDLCNLDWFAGVMSQLGHYEHAEEALNLAVELAPENPDLGLRLAQAQLQNGNHGETCQTLLHLTSDEKVTSETLREAAYVYMRMEDLPAARECLEKAAKQSLDPSSDLLFDLAKLYDRIGEPVEALEAIQQAAIPTCRDPNVFIFKGLLLGRENRYPAALAALENALELAQTAQESRRTCLEAEIYRQMAECQMKSGKLAEALDYSEKALIRTPDDFGIRIQAAELALSLLMIEQALSLATISDMTATDGTEEKLGRLALIRAETSLETGNTDDALHAWEQAVETRQESRWLEAVEARIYVKNGDWIRGAEIARKSLKSLSNQASQDEDGIWVGKAAIAAGLWSDGIQVLEKYNQDYPSDPKGTFELGKAYILAAERDRDCRLVNCKVHLPNRDALSESAHARFAAYMEQAYQATQSPDAERWLLRGEMVFTPNALTIQDFARMAVTPEDTAAVVRALRDTKNWPSAALAAQQYPEALEVQFQLGLGYLTEDPEYGYELVSRLCVHFVQQPMLQALKSQLAERCGDFGGAASALEAAVRLWPEEGGWYAKAGELSAQIGDLEKAVSFWKMAVRLVPENAGYAQAFGKVCLEVGDIETAVEALNAAVRYAPDQLECWLDLANANLKLGNTSAAMQAAQQANAINSIDVRGVLLCSDIAAEMGDVEASSEYAQVALRRDPRNPGAVLALSKALTKQGLLKESLEKIEEHITELPHSLPLLFERAKLIYQLNGAAAASGLLMKLAQMYPEDAGVLAMLANIQVESGDLKGGENSAFRSLRLDPNQPQLTLMLAKLIRNTGQLDQVVHLLSETIRMQPDNLDAYLVLGQTYVDRREHDTALEVFRRAIHADPKDPRGYFQAALIFKDSKDYVSAETMLQNAAKLNPKDLQVRRQLIAVMALNLIHKSQEANTIV